MDGLPITLLVKLLLVGLVEVLETEAIDIAVLAPETLLLFLPLTPPMIVP